MSYSDEFLYDNKVDNGVNNCEKVLKPFIASSTTMGTVKAIVIKSAIQAIIIGYYHLLEDFLELALKFQFGLISFVVIHFVCKEVKKKMCIVP